MIPKVSIIVPVYNGERKIDRCIKSILNQTIDSYEIICINDGSTDRTAEILEGYVEQYSDIVKVIHTENQGVSKARIEGIQRACGEFVGFVDCDDEVLPDMYEAMYDLAKKKSADIAVCGYKRVDEKGKSKTEMCDWDMDILEISQSIERLATINTALWNKIIKRSIVDRAIDFEESPRVAEDMLFLLSIYPFCERIVFLKEPLYLYYVEAGSAMTYFMAQEMNILCVDMELTRQYILANVNDKYLWNYLCVLFVLVHLGCSVILRTDNKGKYGCVQKVYQYLDKIEPKWKCNILLRKKGNHMLKVKMVEFAYKTRLIYAAIAMNKIVIKLIRW